MSTATATLSSPVVSTKTSPTYECRFQVVKVNLDDDFCPAGPEDMGVEWSRSLSLGDTALIAEFDTLDEAIADAIRRNAVLFESHVYAEAWCIVVVKVVPITAAE